MNEALDKYFNVHHPEYDQDTFHIYDFVDTERFRPCIENNEWVYPEMSDPNYVDWWFEQEARCKQGYVVENATKSGKDIWISGRMYFYLNFWVIYGLNPKTGIKGNIPPRFTSLDYFKFMSLERMFHEKKDELFGKARQKGFSEFIACNLAYNFSFIPGSQNAVVAGEVKYSTHTMDNVIKGLNHLSKTEFYKNRQPNRETEYIRASFTETEELEDGSKISRVEGFLSEIYCITAKDNTQAVSRLSPFFLVYEEIGKWKKGSLKETSEFVKASLEAEGKKTGFQVFIGTGGDMEESVADVEEMMYAPHKFGLLEYENKFEEEVQTNENKIANFIPAWEFEIIDVDGNSLRAESIEKLMQDRSTKKAAEKYRAITQKPIYLSEMFLVSTSGFFGKIVISKLNDRKALLRKKRELNIGEWGKLDWINPDNQHEGVVWTVSPENVESEEFGIFVTQKPERDSAGQVFQNLYGTATDSYDKTESNTSGSKGSCTVFKDFLDANHTYKHWVARITQRPSEEQGGNAEFYENTAKLTMWYNSVNLIEWSNVLIFEWYKQHKLEYLLKERPDFVIANMVQNSKVQNKYGIDPASKIHWLTKLREALKRSNYALIDQMHDLEIINALARFKLDKDFNCDITISTSLNIVLQEDEEHIMVYSENEEEVKENRRVGMAFKNINGRLVRA